MEKKKVTILIIDDVKAARTLYKKFLNITGILDCEYLEAGTIKDGIGLFDDNDPDCILLDYELPDGTGIDFLKHYNSSARIAIPVLMLTGHNSEDIAFEAINLGVADYLEKSQCNQIRLTISVVNAIRRKKAEKDLYLKNNVVESSMDAICITNTEGFFEYANKAFLKIYETTAENVMGKHFSSIIPNTEALDLIIKAQQKKQPLVRTITSRTSDGKEFYSLIKVQMLKADEEIPTHIMAVISDITEQKRVEEKIQAVNERLNYLVSENPAVIFTKQINGGQIGGITFVTNNIKNILGFEGGEFTGADKLDFWKNCVHPDDLPHLLAQFAKLPEKQHATYEYRFKDARGHYRWLHDEQRLITIDEEKKEILGSWNDITGQKEQEKKLQSTMNEIKLHNKLMMGREERIIEMKKEVNALLNVLNLPSKYKSVEI